MNRRPESYWALRSTLEQTDRLHLLDDLSPAQRSRLWNGDLSLAELLTPRALGLAPEADIDVLVIGSGMAGVVAAQELVAAGLRVIVLEAGSRTGGRAVTDSSTGHALDLGAAWLHGGEGNPLTEVTRRLGLTLVLDPHRVRAYRDGVEDSEQFARCLERVDRAWVEAGTLADVPLSEVPLPGPDHWNEEATLALSALSIGVEATEGSSRDYSEMMDEIGDYLVLEGLGRVVEAFTHGLDIEKNRPVRRVLWGPGGVEVETGSGHRYRARLLILTPAVGVLSAGTIAFEPPLPESKVNALRSLQMGCLDKIVLRFDGSVLGDTEANTVVYSKGRKMAFLVRPFGLEVAIGFVGGRTAAAMAVMSVEDEVAAALSELAALYGEPVRPALAASQVTRWAQDPLTLGSYSAALPGRQAQRRELCRPEINLILAGEACHDRWAGTLTGAYLSGLQAATEALRQLRGGTLPGANPAA